MTIDQDPSKLKKENFEMFEKLCDQFCDLLPHFRDFSEYSSRKISVKKESFGICIKKDRKEICVISSSPDNKIFFTCVLSSGNTFVILLKDRDDEFWGKEEVNEGLIIVEGVIANLESILHEDIEIMQSTINGNLGMVH